MIGDDLMNPDTPLAAHLTEPTRIGDEISITGKWIPTRPGGRFRTSEESRDMLAEWEDIQVAHFRSFCGSEPDPQGRGENHIF